MRPPAPPQEPPAMDGLRRRLWLLASLNAADVLLSTMLVSAPAGEANPLLSWVMQRWGVVPGMAVPKALLLGLLWAGLERARRSGSLTLPWPRMLAAANLFYVAVVGYSLGMLLGRHLLPWLA